MVIEELLFRINPDERDDWLEIEAATWTQFLQRQDGFVSKQVWVEHDDDWMVHVVIQWESLAQWKAITSEQCAVVDQQMGDMFRPALECRAHEIVR